MQRMDAQQLQDLMESAIIPDGGHNEMDFERTVDYLEHWALSQYGERAGGRDSMGN